MSASPVFTSIELTTALHDLGVKFIIGDSYTNGTLHKDPVRLIAGLAESNDARLRLSLIPLFLEHPEFSKYVSIVLGRINEPAQLTLRCYYSAAVLLQKIHAVKLGVLLGAIKPLPDLCSTDLNLTVTDDAETNLQLLAKRHQELSHSRVNWLGTYTHAARVWMRGLELQNA